MTPSRWRQLESLYNQALEVDATERTAFLREACGNDLDLRRDLEELFAEEPQAASFLEKAALREIAQEFAATAPDWPSSSSWVGRQIGNYQVVSLIGAGGMGEVYRAHDTKLKREVAIKILPDEFSSDPDRVTRFQREAELLASLNHPSIAAIYDLEETDSHRFLILELVDGETLEERLKRGPLPLTDALQLASQIAEALASAHKCGIIHRDLKPANIKLTPENKAKVLDFGLAKAFAAGAEVNSSRLPTKMQTSIPGTILGTAAYMSPEQASGAVLDRRTDIFAFGAVLYEMLTGAPAFPGETTTEILGAVFKEEPDWSRLPAGTSPVVLHLLRRCLQKDRNRRLHDIADARVEIEDALRVPADSIAVPKQKSRPRRFLLGASAALVVVLAAVLLLWVIQRPVPLPVQRLSANVAEHPVTNSGFPGLSLAISPVTNDLVFVGDNPKQLYIRSQNDTTLKPLPGTRNAAQPFFSPNGEWVAFFTASQIKKVAIAGGSPVTIFDNGKWFGWGVFGAWVDADTIVFGGVSGGGENAALRRIRSDGNGLPEVLTSLDLGQGERTHATPQLIPGTRTVLFGVKFENSRNQVAAVSLATGKRQVVLEDAFRPRYLNNGQLIFMRGDVLLVAPFDLEKLKVVGDAVPVWDDIHRDDGGAPQFVVSASGTLVFMPQGDDGPQTMGSVSKNGTFTPLPVVLTKRKLHPRVSADEQHIAFEIREGGTSSVHIYNVTSGTTTPLTTQGSDELGAWHPNGRQIATFSTRESGRSIVLRDLYGASDRTLVTAPPGTFLRPGNWSPDKVLVYVVQKENKAEIWTVSEDGKPPVLLASGMSPVFSPDGRWVAYASEGNVTVIPYPAGDAIPIAVGKGSAPVWGSEGKELFYLVPDFVRVSINPQGRTLRIGSEEKLFPARVAVGTNGVVEEYARSNAVGPGYDFLRKSEKFVTLRHVVNSTNEIAFVYNWFQEFR